MLRIALVASLISLVAGPAIAACPPSTGDITGPTFRYCIEDQTDPKMAPTVEACLVLDKDDPAVRANQVVCIEALPGESLNGETSATLSVPTPMLCEQNDTWNAYAYGATGQISDPSPVKVIDYLKEQLAQFKEEQG